MVGIGAGWWDLGVIGGAVAMVLNISAVGFIDDGITGLSSPDNAVEVMRFCCGICFESAEVIAADGTEGCEASREVEGKGEGKGEGIEEEEEE